LNSAKVQIEQYQLAALDAMSNPVLQLSRAHLLAAEQALKQVRGNLMHRAWMQVALIREGVIATLLAPVQPVQARAGPMGERVDRVD
jgi:hypothetical protein